MSDSITGFYDQWHLSAGANRAAEIRDRDIMALDYLKDCESVFELGCGAGTVLSMCSASYKAGVDISAKAIEHAKDLTTKTEPIDLKVVNIDMEDIPWETASFNGVMAIEVLEHLFDPVHALAEMNRILKRNGKIVVTVPNIGYYYFRWYHLKSGEMSDFTGNGLIVNEHIRFYSVKAIRLLLQLTGFKVVNVRGAQKIIVKSQETPTTASSGGSKLRRIAKGLMPTPMNILSKSNRLFGLWRKYPSLFAVGLVVEAVKEEESKYKYNSAIDHQVRTSDEYELNVNTL